MVHVEWSDAALADLRSIHAYIANHSPIAAERMVRRIVHATDRLILFPKAGEVIPEVACCEVRQILCKPYRIFYRQLNDEVCRIVGVIHSAQDFGFTFDPKDLASLE